MWEELYERHYSELMVYGKALCKNKELTEDLVQETFVRAIMNTELLEDMSSRKQRAWLYRTFKNIFYDRYRRTLLENKYIQTVKTEAWEEQGFQEVENQLILQSITPEDRTMFQLRYIEGYTSAEISELLNVPAGTVRSRLSRCRKYLKKTLEL